MSTAQVPAELLAALRDVRVDPGRITAAVGARELDAETPRQLRRLLANALYEHLHTGSEPIEGPLPFRMRDSGFERQLAEAVPHRQTVVRSRVQAVRGEGTRRRWLVGLDGVRVWVPPDAITSEPGWTVGDTVTVASSPCRPALSPGFFLVKGSSPNQTSQLLRVYVSIPDWRDAPPVWRSVLAHLEDRQVDYRAKVLSAKDLYPRRDTLVVYLDPQWRRLAGELAELLRAAPGLGEQTSLLARPLAPGICAAWEPNDHRPGMTGLSYGQHRASVIADALVDAAADGTPVEELLAERLRTANVDPTDLSRNLDSPPTGDSPPVDDRMLVPA